MMKMALCLSVHREQKHFEAKTEASTKLILLKPQKIPENYTYTEP